MPHIRLPKVKLGFLKKLLPKRFESRVVQEQEANVDYGKQHVNHEKAALEEVPVEPLEECPICHDPVGVTNPEGILESWVHLHCNHKFGTQCIQTWLQESIEREPFSVPSCPICRAPAKHPCGHRIVIPAPRLYPRLHPFARWTTTPHSPASYQHRGRRPRRRLTRRLGHPLRPSPPQPERARVQTVGECTICAATAAAREENMREMTASSVEMGGATYSGRGWNGDRRNGIKSMLLQTSLRRLSWSTPEPARDDDFTILINTLTNRVTTVVPDTPVTIPLEYMNLCRTEITVARSPTPAPVAHRAMSSC